MNNLYRYTLQRGSKKHSCPHCNKPRLVRYIDRHTGHYLPNQYGRCDREVNCGYHLNPFQDGYKEGIEESYNVPQLQSIQTKLKKTEPVFIPYSIYQNFLQDYEQNNFSNNLLYSVSFPFEIGDIEQIISLYHLGTIKQTHAVCFPFIDNSNNIRAVQTKIFNSDNSTDKAKRYHTSWLHTWLQYNNHKKQNLPEWLEQYCKQERKVSCLFGEHLLSKYSCNPVAIVEAPKTAIYGTLYFGGPNHTNNLLWLAVGNLSSLTLDKCKALKGRKVYLFPDLSKDGKAFQLWTDKARYIQRHLKNTYFTVSNLLEQLAPDHDKRQGKDIADYLIKQDWRLFRKQDMNDVSPIPNEPIKSTICEKGVKSEAIIPTFIPDPRPFIKPYEKDQGQNWDVEIKELESFFQDKNNPPWVESHLAFVKAQNGNVTYLPYLMRLKEYKASLIKE